MAIHASNDDHACIFFHGSCATAMLGMLSASGTARDLAPGICMLLRGGTEAGCSEQSPRSSLSQPHRRHAVHGVSAPRRSPLMIRHVARPLVTPQRWLEQVNRHLSVSTA